MRDLQNLAGSLVDKSVTLELIEINNAVAIVRLVFSPYTTKEGLETRKWMTEVLWKELLETLKNCCLQFIQKLAKPCDPVTVSSGALSISYVFKPDVEKYGPAFDFANGSQMKENLASQNLVFLDHVLHVTASLKSAPKNFQPSSPQVLQQTQNIVEQTPPRNVSMKSIMSRINVERPIFEDFEDCFVATSPFQVYGHASSKKKEPLSDSNITMSNTASSSTTAAAEKPRIPKATGHMNKLSLKKKDSGNKTQMSITGFLISTPPRDEVQVKKEEVENSSESSQENTNLKRKVSDNEKPSSSKMMKKKGKKENIKKRTAVKQEAGSHSKAPSKKTGEEQQDYPTTPVRRTIKEQPASSPDLFEDDGVPLMNKMKNLLSLMRTPVKVSTPRPSLQLEEDNYLLDYLIPDDDLQVKKDCDKLRESFESGDVDSIDEELVKRTFLLHLQYLRDIEAGKVFSQRHQLYNECYENRNTMKYADGSIIFSMENLMVISKLMGDHLSTDSYENIEKVNYFLKVLVPELLLKILMSVYKITKTEAMDKMFEIAVRVSEMCGSF